MHLLDLIYPPRCGGCRRTGWSWCSRCAAAVDPLVAADLHGVPLIAAGRLEGPLQAAVHIYKYRPRPYLASAMAGLLAAAVQRSGIALTGLTFVPLHPSRRRERGFNQAERLACELGKALSLPLVGGIERIRPTPPQVGSLKAERRANVAGAFAWLSPQRPPAGLGLVDDVCTTGATLEAAGAAVAQAGGRLAAYLVLARAQTLPARAVTFPGQPGCP